VRINVFILFVAIQACILVAPCVSQVCCWADGINVLVFDNGAIPIANIAGMLDAAEMSTM